jgi:hypothetical protein
VSPSPTATWAATQAPVGERLLLLELSSLRRRRDRTCPKDAGPKDGGGGASLRWLLLSGAAEQRAPRGHDDVGGEAAEPGLPRPDPASPGLDSRLAVVGASRTAPAARDTASEGARRSYAPLPRSASPTGGSTTGDGRGTRSGGGGFRRRRDRWRPSRGPRSQRRTSDGDLDAGLRLAAASRIPRRAGRRHGGVARPQAWHHGGAAVTCPVVRCAAPQWRLLLLQQMFRNRALR